MTKKRRTINTARLHSWLSDVGEAEGRARLARTCISFQTLDRILRGHGSLRASTMQALSVATGISVDELFPLDVAENRAS